MAERNRNPYDEETGSDEMNRNERGYGYGNFGGYGTYYGNPGYRRNFDRGNHEERVRRGQNRPGMERGYRPREDYEELGFDQEDARRFNENLDYAYGQYSGRGQAYTGNRPDFEGPINTNFGYYRPWNDDADLESYGANREHRGERMNEGPYSGMGPQGYQRSDNRIHEDVCDRMTMHGQLDARNITVRVENGEVHLEGSVNSRRAKRMAEDVADSVRGVRDVHNHLHVMDETSTTTTRAGETKTTTGDRS